MPTSANQKHRREQAGYSLLMVIFLVATMLVWASVAALKIDTQGRRERETEMVWRGRQYERAIGLYYRKFGKYPTKVDDLVKQTNGIRFLRQAYKDPMNKEDGSWRFIYVGPNGQLIGSMRQTSLLQSVLSTVPPGGTSPFGVNAMQSPAPPASGATPGSPGSPGQPGQTGQTANPASTPDPLASQPQPLQGAVIGGNIIGIGSKMKDSSLRVYEGGDTYEQWEFIFNPIQQVAIPGQGPANPAAPPAPGAPVAPGATAAPGAPTVPPPDAPPQGSLPPAQAAPPTQ